VVRDDSRARPPRDFVRVGEWPYAILTDHHAAAVAQLVAQRLAEAMAGRGMSANRLARLSGVNRQTVANVLAGAVWPDLMTIANLERHLGCLWPTESDSLAGMENESQQS
jgi:ribosome-binding protein aMBF1 (putative translation factor)